MRVHCLQHVAFEGPANIAAWARERGHAVSGTALFSAQPLPGMADLDWLVVMGGPMSVHDEDRYPWLADEKRLIGSTLNAGKPVLGVCLGSQLLAQVLGARVYRNQHREIGWFPARRGPDADASPLFSELPAEFSAFHWHGDAFDLPAGAQHLAYSDASPVQAFSYGTAVGLLCHLEMTREAVAELIRHCAHEIGAGPYQQPPDEMLAPSAPFEAIKHTLWRILDCTAEMTGFPASRSSSSRG